MAVRLLWVGVWLIGIAGIAPAQLAPAPDPVGPDATFLEVSDVRVQGTSPATLSEAEVRGLEVVLSRVAGGWVAPRRDLPREHVPIGALAGSSLRLYGSALESIENALALAHARAGRADVAIELRPGSVRYAHGGLERRDLIVELRPVAARTAPEPVPASPGRLGADAVLVSVRALALEGLQGLGIREEELLDLAVELSWDVGQIPPGWVAARSDLPVRELRLWEVGRFAADGAQLYGSALQSILFQVGQALSARGVERVTVDLAPGALRRLATPGGDGLLVLSIVRD